MRKIFISLIVLSLFSLVGCKKKREPVLLGPEKVSFKSPGNILTWNEEEGAIGYVVLINGQEITVNNNSYDMNDYEPGEYKIRVRTLYEGKTSNYSPELKVYLLETLSIYVKNFKIYITNIENAEYRYTMRVDHIKKEGTVTDGIINIPTEFQDRAIDFKLVILVNGSVRHSFETEISLILNNTLKDRDLEILVNNPHSVYIDGEIVEATLLSDRVIISKETLNSLNSEVILAVSGDTYIIKKLYITDPFVVLTSEKIINETDELKFTFELNGFTFDGIAKEEFSLGVDYFFEGEVLTFSDTFISKYKELFPDSKNIYLMTVFRRSGETVLINITIKLDA